MEIKATVIADSINECGDRITSLVLDYPRFIHSEFMTHRAFSRNAASSRAVPFWKMVERVQKDPVIPIAWQKDHKGMQGTEYVTDPDEIEKRNQQWLQAGDYVVENAIKLYEMGTTKQLCNRLLEPFMNYKVLVTSTEWENFFKLRCPQYKMVNDSGVVIYYKSRKEYLEDLSTIDYNQSIKWTDLDWLKINESQAEIHIQLLAESIWDARNDSEPKKLKPGQWHIPFGDNMDDDLVFDAIKSTYQSGEYEYFKEPYNVRIATARCARTSYFNFDGNDDYKADLKLHDNLKAYNHASPFEHCAEAQGFVNRGRSRNFMGFTQYREILNM